MFRSSNFDKNLDTATSHLRLEPDWPSILLVCDAIRQKDVNAKAAFAAIKKKMISPNPHSAYYSLLVLESVVKNCGTPIHEEVFTKENCEMFSTLIENTQHENVRAKLLELIQCWANAFRSMEKYQAIKDTMNILKVRGHKFPELKEADAMFTADTAPHWEDGKCCHRCRTDFSFTIRKHHCRNCGQIFCAQCSSKTSPLPKFGIEKEVRVCDGCFAILSKPFNSKKPSSNENELPEEYLKSSLAQQSQVPARKSEQELKEEEELQLAIALSQSEADASKAKSIQAFNNFRIYQRTPSPEAPPPTPPAIGMDEAATDPELAKYLNRSYWEQRKLTESPNSMISPTAPSPSISIASSHPQTTIIPQTAGDAEIEEFSTNLKAQLEIFVNRMKSNSSRGRSISNDSSVQTLFMNLTALHSQLMNYKKETDDRRMWYEQLQDKLTQVKDSRAALDVLRQEHIEKMRMISKEQDRQRQHAMAQKLELMRKKKHEYLQYQREVALQRIQEEEREMQMRQEKQMAQYRMGQTSFPFNSPRHSGYQSVPYGHPQSLDMKQPSPGMFYGNFGPGSLGSMNPLPVQMNDGQKLQQYITTGQHFFPPPQQQNQLQQPSSEQGPQINGQHAMGQIQPSQQNRQMPPPQQNRQIQPPQQNQQMQLPYQQHLGHLPNHPIPQGGNQSQSQPLAAPQQQAPIHAPPHSQSQMPMMPPQGQPQVVMNHQMFPQASLQSNPQIPAAPSQVPQPPHSLTQQMPLQQIAPQTQSAVAPPSEPEPEPANEVKVNEEKTEVQTAELISFD